MSRNRLEVSFLDEDELASGWRMLLEVVALRSVRHEVTWVVWKVLSSMIAETDVEGGECCYYSTFLLL